MSVYRIDDRLLFPDPEEAEPSGLLGVGGDLRPSRLLLAYSQGIFPWYSDELPILWFSPDPRLVLEPGRLHLGRTLRRVVRRGTYRVTADRAFERVIERAATVPRPGQDGTWITDDMRRAYTELHELGFAHSVESWQGERLAGGLYGVSLGRAFFGESMFSLEPDASKVALVYLARQLEAWGFDLIDCQVPTEHLMQLGAELWPRRRFLEVLAEAIEAPTRRGRWELDAEILSSSGRSSG